MKLDALRNEYTYSGITRENVAQNPFTQFNQWMREVIDSGEKEPTAMTLSTFGTDGFPHSRIVLLKFIDDEGFTFFTNYKSAKGQDIEINNAVGLHFFWSNLERQIRIVGFAKKTSRELSENYFLTRPVESQIGAWASDQSEEIESRNYLESRFEHFKNKFQDQIVPLPSHWGGYKIIPQKIEFWQGRNSRLHDRILYEKVNESWKIKRLAP